MMKKRLFPCVLALLVFIISYGQDFVWHDITSEISDGKTACFEFRSNSEEIYVRYTFPKKHEHKPGTYREPSEIDLVRLPENGTAQECKGLVTEIHEGHILRAFRNITYKAPKGGDVFRIFLPPGMVWKDCEIGVRPSADYKPVKQENAACIAVFDLKPFKGGSASFWTSRLQLMFDCPMKIYTRADELESMISDDVVLYIVRDKESAEKLRAKTDKKVLIYKAE